MLPRVSHSPRRPGFTLVELLVTITILGILGSAVLFAASAATESARRSNTRIRITALHALLNEFYDSFRTRRVPVTVRGLQTDQAALVRLAMLRQLMVMEIPDRWSDVVGAPIASSTLPGQLSAYQQQWVQMGDLPAMRRTALNLAYLRRYSQMQAVRDRLNDDSEFAERLLRFQGAECLYLVITLATGDGEARSMFRDSDIGDVDEDGAPEFLDAWGNPIRLLRWAPGFPSENQLSLPPDPDQVGPDVFASYAREDPDPFDPYRIDRIPNDSQTPPRPRAFRLVPLIYSGGADGDPGLMTFVSATVSIDDETGFEMINPYPVYNDPSANVRGYMGMPVDLNQDGQTSFNDNIHNHVLSTRF